MNCVYWGKHKKAYKQDQVYAKKPDENEQDN